MNLLATLLFAATATTTQINDSEVWNEGVGYYEAGDVTNAIRVLRPLMLSRTHSARAAELVAKLEAERGNVEEAAAAAHIALKAKPDDERANRNFTRATDGIERYREDKRVEKVLKAAQGKDPSTMLLSSAREARKLLVEAASYRTNAAEKVVALSDALTKRTSAIKDVWIPVREAIAQSVTNEEEAATIIARLDAAEKRTVEAQKAFSDLDDAAYGAIADVESDLTKFVKMTIMPPQAMHEDLICQSNAWQDIEEVNARHWQNDALDYTRAFRAKFPMWAREYEAQAQSDTNKPPFTAEDQAKIAALATELEKLQLECCEKNLPPEQEEAIGMINEIIELLPKDNGGGQGQSGEQGQQNQNQDQQNQQNQDQQQEQQEQNQEQQGEEQDQGENQEEDQGEEAQAEEAEESEEDKDIEALLRKAQERNDEYEADKKARMRKAPLPPNERDW